MVVSDVVYASTFQPALVWDADAWMMVEPRQNFWYPDQNRMQVDPWGANNSEFLDSRTEQFLQSGKKCPLYLYQITRWQTTALLVELPPEEKDLVVVLHPGARIDWQRTTIKSESVPFDGEYDAYTCRFTPGDVLMVQFEGQAFAVTPIPQPKVLSPALAVPFTDAVVPTSAALLVQFNLEDVDWEAQLTAYSGIPGDEEQAVFARSQSKRTPAEHALDLSAVPAGRYRLTIVADDEPIASLDIYWVNDLRKIRLNAPVPLPQIGHEETVTLAIEYAGGEWQQLTHVPLSDGPELIVQLGTRQGGIVPDPLLQLVIPTPCFAWGAAGHPPVRTPIHADVSDLIRAGGLAIVVPQQFANQPIRIESSNGYVVRARRHPGDQGGRILPPRTLRRLIHATTKTTELYLSVGKDRSLIGAFTNENLDDRLSTEFESTGEIDSDWEPESWQAESTSDAPPPRSNVPPDIEWRLVGKFESRWSREVLQLNRSHVGATSTSRIEIRSASGLPRIVPITVGDGPSKRVNIGRASNRVHLGRFDFQSVSQDPRVPIALVSRSGPIVMAEINLQDGARRLGRLWGSRQRKIRELDTIPFHQVAHAARRGADTARELKDGALESIFGEIRDAATAVARHERFDEYSWDEDELRQVVVCAYQLLHEYHLRGIEFRSREIKKWIQAGSRFRSTIAPMLAALQDEYADRVYNRGRET